MRREETMCFQRGNTTHNIILITEYFTHWSQLKFQYLARRLLFSYVETLNQ